jgi:hypothetical protein
MLPLAKLPRMELFLDPENQEGLRPTRDCGRRLLWAIYDAVPEMEAAHKAGIAPLGLLEAVIANHQELVHRYNDSYLDAFRWERQRFGNVAGMIRNVREYRVAA